MFGFSNCRMRFGLSALLRQLGDDTRPAGPMARADARSVVSVEILVEEHQITPMRVVAIPGGFVHRPGVLLISYLKNIRVRRREISAATSQSIMYWPAPVGHSTLKSSPR